MAFSFAHQAIVLPIAEKNKKYFNNIGLIIGTMAPDFEYFLAFKPYSKIGHSIIGMFTINIILSFLVYLYYIRYKNVFIVNLPNIFSNRLGFIYRDRGKLKDLKEIAVFIYSLLIGMTTHIIWDSFTHINGFFVFHSRFLNVMIFNIPIYKYLQHLSTLVGFCIIIYFILKRKKDNNFDIDINTKFKYWIKLFIISFILTMVFLVILKDISIGRIIITFINSFFISIIILTVF